MGRTRPLPGGNPMPRTRFQMMTRIATLATTLATLTLLIATLSANISAQSAVGQLLRHRPLNGRHQSGPPASAPTGVGSNPFLLIDYPGGTANQYPADINDKGKMVGLAEF